MPADALVGTPDTVTPPVGSSPADNEADSSVLTKTSIMTPRCSVHSFNKPRLRAACGTVCVRAADLDARIQLGPDELCMEAPPGAPPLA